ncbi:MAG: hypothetical protein HETSPECPRED_005787 [Heterodermia speciosa]|uniref:Cyanovirin-N domain-containing protein n=1 Tax=Heterodermia speciosa TaxID=116794 RepID=A0A8H3IEN1_9LECA|nr:MAG: hypothetical protein HETSPECPRED_005787 [Heterodermia speciosa]
MLSSTALLCAAILLKSIYALPRDPGSTTFTGGVEPSTNTLSSRDTPPAAFEFYDSCPTDSPNAKSKGIAVQKYIPKTCQELDAKGDIMMIDWTAAGVDAFAIFADRLCMNCTGGIPREGMNTTSCFDVSDSDRQKVRSVRSLFRPPEKKREILPSTSTLSMRDTIYQAPGGPSANCGSAGGCVTSLPPPLPEAVNSYDRCPYEANGNLLEAEKTGGNVTGYIVGTCQAIDLPGPIMSVNFRDNKFDRMVIYHDQHCTDRITGYDRNTVIWKDYMCIDFRNFQKVLSFKGVIMQKHR